MARKTTHTLLEGLNLVQMTTPELIAELERIIAATLPEMHHRYYMERIEAMGRLGAALRERLEGGAG